MNRKKIKLIFWDVDGVLVDLNKTYYDFITTHPKFKDKFKDLKYKDLPKVLPINKKYGAMELSTHPTLGKELDEEFCKSNTYYFNRKFYKNTKKTLKEFDKLGFIQVTMSAGFNLEKKNKLLNNLFKNLPFIKIVAVEHDKNGMSQGNTKERKMLEILKQFKINPEESVLVDDRIYNIYSAIKAHIKPIRFRSEFTTDLPEDIENIVEVKNILDFKKWLLTYNKISIKNI